MLGHSLGGLLVLRYMQQTQLDPQQLRSVTLLSAPVQGTILGRHLWRELRSLFSPALRRAFADYGAWGLIPAVGRFKRGEYPLRLRAASADAVGATVGLDGRAVSGAAIADYVAFVDQLTAEFAASSPAGLQQAPLLFMVGACDAVTPPATAQALVSALPAAALSIIPGETHFTLPLSELCCRQICAFLHSHQ
jgi:pimeloyl-ACP methyl ester carboxylesterase